MNVLMVLQKDKSRYAFLVHNALSHCAYNRFRINSVATHIVTTKYHPVPTQYVDIHPYM